MTKYASIVGDICGISWDRLNKQTLSSDLEAERDGWIGVSCVIAYMKGVQPTTEAMAQHFAVSRNDVDAPMRRLHRNKIFDKKNDIREDQILLGKDIDPMITRRAWCGIAGIASNFCGEVIVEG
tara:strand:+ start:134 stop:505 length:372 start_codon:yes stop_codon:yes gene_type:complete